MLRKQVGIYHILLLTRYYTYPHIENVILAFGTLGERLTKDISIETVNCIVGLALDIIFRFLPLILSYGLQSFDPSKFCTNNHRWPNYGTQNIMGE